MSLSRETSASYHRLSHLGMGAPNAPFLGREVEFEEFLKRHHVHIMPVRSMGDAGRTTRGAARRARALDRYPLALPCKVLHCELRREVIPRTQIHLMMEHPEDGLANVLVERPHVRVG